MIKNRREFIKIAALGMGMGFTGCANSMQSLGLSAPDLKPTKLPFKDVVVTGDKYIVKNGYIVDNNGNKIFDEEGDIKQVFDIKNNWFYLLNIPSNSKWKIKDLNTKKTIREFNSYEVIVFYDKNKVFIGEQFKSYNGNQIFDNVYVFDGNHFNLINKNVIWNGFLTSRGVYVLNQNKALDIRTSSLLTPKNLPGEYKNCSWFVLGSVNENLVFYGQVGILGNDGAIAVYNNGKVYTIISKSELNKDGYGKLQFLVSGKKVVLKVIYPDNSKIRYFYLNDLIEVKGCDNSFKPIKILDRHINGSDISGWVDKYTFSLLGLYYYDVIKNRPFALF